MIAGNQAAPSRRCGLCKGQSPLKRSGAPLAKRTSSGSRSWQCVTLTLSSVFLRRAPLEEEFASRHPKPVLSSLSTAPVPGLPVFAQYPVVSSRGPCPAINCFHTYTPPYIFFIFHLLPLFVFIIFLHSFLPISSVFYHHFSKIFAILFSFLLASFISPTTLQNVISSISSPHPFQKNKFCKIYCKKYLSSKNIRTV